MSERPSLSIVVLGASYGLLPALKIAAAGHAVTLVGRKEEGEALARDGIEVLVPSREDGRTLRLAARVQPGLASEPGPLGFVEPDRAEPENHDLAILAMSEPQYADAAVALLMARVAATRRPCLSLMNLPPLCFLRRLPGFDADAAAAAYVVPDLWGRFDPALMSSASPDPQAVRLDPSRPGCLTVTLASNFKMAPFPDPQHQALLARIAADVDGLRHPTDDGPFASRVRLVAHASPYVPLAKWPMLIAGNCRCVREGAPSSIRDAVHDDVGESRAVYDWVRDLALRIGAAEDDLVPFERYAEAARSLSMPSSLARALWAGAPRVERIDLLVGLTGRSVGMESALLGAITARIETLLARNRAVAN